MLEAIFAPVQTVDDGGGVIFGSPKISTGCGVRHEAGSARFVLVKCGIYLVQFSGNIAIPTGGTVGPISVALSVDGETIAGTDAIFTPAAVGDFGNVSISTLVRVYGCGGNVSASVVNASGEPIEVQDASLLIFRECGDCA